MGGTPQKERLTDQLLEQLLASATPEAYLIGSGIVDRSLTDYLNQLLAEKELKKSQVIRASGVNPTFCYQIFSGARRPNRDTAIKLAFGLGCSLIETQRLLRTAGHSELWCKIPRDAIIIFAIEHGYTREQADDDLYRLGEETLLGDE